MNKSKNFSGQPIISQVLKFIPSSLINRTAQKQGSDRYYKRFKTYDHLVTMLFATLSGSSSLREVSSIMLACEGKINHLGLTRFPKRSTLSDANKNRPSAVFASIYQQLYGRYKHFLSDSYSRSLPVKDLKIVDSSTISLFSDVLKGAGRNPIGGKKKGGIKMHTMINAQEDVPCLVRFSSAATHDHTFLKELGLQKGSFVVFDKGYVDYMQYHNWTVEGVYFVTRQKDNALYSSLEEFALDEHIHSGVLKDERIEIAKGKQVIYLRRVAFYHQQQNRVYEFITNNFELPADKITDIYKQRWQIETLFKRLKQNFPLKYFLGDNQNAIEIQIWMSLIIQLIMLVIQRKAKRKWAFSNMMSVIRYHLMTYIDLFKFLKKPDGDWSELNNRKKGQLTLFQT
ncbi:IS4 family transposase [Solitalea koreensis]|uniref:Transposase, IS4 family n=1 Tax=Solitalea koreensis TaxID=543615 RepID=A0A521ER62_9SPHI|nr:IS4 family transposase [Solitalea koreensis]SMO86387.1 protein of unknown function [Solitalea koreensis]